ncbi:MAG: Na(+)-translocating NADH-quinone reductase subunit A [Parachlamydiaceae bacterium]|nr:Na(+)-translocating NADH-quinone reductase subunit A [Parachlamydiaceae bacterium]
MVHIKISKGLDIPLKGKPSGNVQLLTRGGESSPLATPAQISLDLQPFEDIKLKLLVKPDDHVLIGQPLAENKANPGSFLVSPAAGTIKEIRRGAKRVPLEIIIDVAKEESYYAYPKIEAERATPEELIELFKHAGIFFSIRSRPFNLLCSPEKKPRSIFVKAVESAPLTPPAELHVMGHEKAFQMGLNALAKLAKGSVHLVYRVDTNLRAFTDAQNVQKHTVEGPHPAANASLHIQNIDPITSVDDHVWTLSARDVVAIGHLLLTGQHFIERIISIAGPGILPAKVGYFKIREGFPIAALIAGRVPKGTMRFISGDPLMGKKVTATEFLGYNDTVFCAIPESNEREFLHFFRLGMDKYTFSKTYGSGHLNNKNREYDFTTIQHGEQRAFIDSTLYDKVMPLDVPTMLLVKAVMAEDFDSAVKLGLLEVDSEDFALPTFVCLSKMEMTEIIKTGLQQYSKEVLA